MYQEAYEYQHETGQGGWRRGLAYTVTAMRDLLTVLVLLELYADVSDWVILGECAFSLTLKELVSDAS